MQVFPVCRNDLADHGLGNHTQILVSAFLKANIDNDQMVEEFFYNMGQETALDHL